jgi:hypothetical protein
MRGRVGVNGLRGLFSALDSRADAPVPPAPDPGRAADRETPQHTAKRLTGLIEQVSAEEFHWQEVNYDRDSAFGRELLFRIAHNEWIRATAEVVDVMRADALDTTIKVEIDPDLVSREARRHENRRLWLPVLVLPPLGEPGAVPLREPDSFITLTVTDSNGHPFATLPGADVRHRVAAGLAEIVVNMATARWPDTGDSGPSATRDQRLVLSAALYRLLSGEQAPADADPVESPSGPDASSQVNTGRGQLQRTLKPFLRGPDAAGAPGADAGGDSSAAPPKAPGSAGEPAPDSASALLQLLTERAISVLQAFCDSVIIVVPVESDRIPSMLTIQIPSRALNPPPREGWRPRGPKAWRWLQAGGWNWILPRAHLQVNLLLPSADADRLVQVNLPDGISVFPAQPEKAAKMDIEVEQPSAMRHLSELMTQLTGELKGPPGDPPSPLARSLADLAALNAAAARHALRGYLAKVQEPLAGQHDDTVPADSNAVRASLHELGKALASFSSGNAAAAADVARLWKDGSCRPWKLFRVTSVDILAPQTAVAKARMIDDHASRAAPVEGKIQLHVAVTDAQPFSIATFSGWMSLLLMLVVLALLTVSEDFFRLSGPQVSPEVLAIVLTLFAAIQAGRIERPDTSALRGKLSANGNGLIVLSVLPAVVLAVALAFSRSGWWPFTWAGGCIAAQLTLQALMRLRSQSAKNRSGEQTAAPLVGELELSTHKPVYVDDAALHSSWWRATTANALQIDTPAYGYVVHRGPGGRGLRQLLREAAPSSGSSRTPRPDDSWGKTAAEMPGPSYTQGGFRTDQREPYADRTDETRQSAVPGRPANLLALLESGTLKQSLTFAVFREQPTADWGSPPVNTPPDREVMPVQLDFDQLAPTEDLFGMVDIFVGVPSSPELLTVAEHPVTAVLRVAAEQQPLVMEAQMPVPPPARAWTGLQCAWIRVGLRDSDIRCLAGFLHAVRNCITAIRPRSPLPGDSYVVAVKTVPESELRILSGELPAPAGTAGQLTLARDLDVITAYQAHASESDSDRTWRAMAICANYRSGIESRIAGEVDQEMRIAGMTYALLQGKAVVLLLGHQPDGEGADRRRRPNANIEVVADLPLAREELGWAGSEPLLEVHVRSPNRPGTTGEVLDAMAVALRKQCSLEPARWNVWHARTVVTPENLALIRFTLRLSVEPGLVKQWNESSRFEAVERSVRAQVMGGRTASADDPGNQDPDSGAVEEFIIRIRSIIQGRGILPDARLG